MSLYLLIEVCSVIVPLIYSFDKNMQFHKNWKSVLAAFTITSAIYISGDIYFTHHGIWGFNPAYHVNFKLLGIPPEEWLFFWVIPYASIFLHYTFAFYFPRVILGEKLTKVISVTLIVILVVVIFLNLEKIYTVFNCTILCAALIFSLFDKTKTINRYYITFLIILGPFLLINSVLTGSFIDGEVYWYNNNYNLGIRVFTMPLEDIGYGFSLLLLNLLLMTKFQVVFKSKSNDRVLG